jgi:hypothetical protein
MSLAMKNVSAPSTDVNTILSDFFTLNPNQKVLAPYTIKTHAGEMRRELIIPDIDAVIGNPPYTRWTEMTKKSREAVSLSVGEILSRYDLRPGGVRSEPMIFVHFVMQGTRFLRDGGRLGMIVSNLWLQTEYGVKFGEFLLDNYKVRAVIDFTLRLFNALISTCILLVEKESVSSERENNIVTFIHIPGAVDNINVASLLKTIKTGKSNKFIVKTFSQKEISREKKWIDTFLGLDTVLNNGTFTKAENYFDIIRSNLNWSIFAMKNGARPDAGASDFNYLSPSKVKEWNMTSIAYPESNLDDSVVWPALTSSRQSTNFTFTERDWKLLAKRDSRCYMFIGHRKRKKLPKAAQEYVIWGETECRTKIRGTRGGGRLASETESAKLRAASNEFYGWYDLGGVRPALFFAIYQAWWKTRFVRCEFPLAMYHGLITYAPKVDLNEMQVEALLAYLNSSFAQHYIETNGRRSGGGIIGFEVSVAREMPIPDIQKVNHKQLNLLAEAFGKLERESRKIGGATKKDQYEKLKPIINRIDNIIGKWLGLTSKQVKEVQMNVDFLVDRRVSSAKEPKPETVKGMHRPKIKIPKKKDKRRNVSNTKPLDTFL